MNPNEPVSLKWRVWIGIAAIVYLLGNVDSYNLHGSIYQLRNDIDRLEKKIGQLEYKLDNSDSRT